MPSNAAGVSLIPGWETKIPQALWPKIQNIRQKQCCNRFNKRLFLKKGPHQKSLFKKRTTDLNSEGTNDIELEPDKSWRLIDHGRNFLF